MLFMAELMFVFLDILSFRFYPKTELKLHGDINYFRKFVEKHLMYNPGFFSWRYIVRKHGNYFYW